MSTQDLEAADRAIEAWNDCRLEAFVREWDPECEWRPAFPQGTEGTGSVFCGHDGLARAWHSVRAAWTVYLLDIDDVRPVGDRVLFLGQIHAKGAASGIELDEGWSAVLRFRDGRILSAWDWLNREDGLAAVGPRE